MLPRDQPNSSPRIMRRATLRQNRSHRIRPEYPRSFPTSCSTTPSSLRRRELTSIWDSSFRAVMRVAPVPLNLADPSRIHAQPGETRAGRKQGDYGAADSKDDRSVGEAGHANHECD